MQHKKRISIRAKIKLLFPIAAVIVITITLLYCLTFQADSDNVESVIYNEKTNCFRDNKNLHRKNEIVIEDVLQSNRFPRKDKTIFFHVTNCLEDGLLKLNPRQSCAIESAAFKNPSFDVFVLFASPTYYPQIMPKEIIALLQYPNIFLRNSDLWNYTRNTPAATWFETGVLFKSDFLTAHMSDFLRLMTLWRWGGIYMDLDVIVKESFENITLNFAGAESLDVVASGVMSYDSTGFGHYIVDLMLKRFVEDFRGDLWAHNGPLRITDVLMDDICKTNDTQFMTSERCHGFRVFPIKTFYAIHYSNWRFFFEEKYLNQSLAMTEHSLLLHAWNKISSGTKLKKGTQAAYMIYAEKLCPNVYSLIEDYF